MSFTSLPFIMKLPLLLADKVVHNNQQQLLEEDTASYLAIVVTFTFTHYNSDRF